MRVVLFPLDVWGCGRYRMFWPAAAAAGKVDGVDVEIVKPERRSVTIHLGANGLVKSEEFDVGEGDVAVFQRPSATFMPQVIQLLQARGVGVCIDMDDDLAMLHPKNIAWMGFHPKTRNGHSWETAAESCRIADMMVVTTPQLARRYGNHGRVAVIPNMVPERYLDIPHRDSTDIGWAGSVQSHPDDLQVTGSSIAQIVNSRLAVFRTVGDQTEVAEVLGLREKPPGPGPVEIEQYPVEVAEFGIGIAPLAMTKFNQAKSRLKGLEYSALGVPWVGSPTEDYKLLHAEGAGLLAERPKEWSRHLRTLIRDDSMRRDMSAAGREVAARMTFERNWHLWVEAWRAAARA